MRNQRVFRSTMLPTESNPEVWLVHFLIQMRFPGFCGDIVNEFWRLKEDKTTNGLKLSDTRIAMMLVEMNPDLTDRQDPITDKQPTGPETEPVADAILVWLKKIQEYDEKLHNGLAKEILEELLQSSLASETSDGPRPKVNINVTYQEPKQDTDYANWLRYSKWSPEEAVEYTLRTSSGDEYSKRLSRLTEEMRTNPNLRQLIPENFISWALENDWLDEPEIAKYPELEEFLVELAAPKRLTSLYKVILGMAVDKYDLDPAKIDHSRALGLIRSSILNAGGQIDPKTVKEVLVQATDGLAKDGNQEFIAKSAR